MVIADHDWWRCPKKECRAKWDYESKRCPSCGSSGVTEPAGEKHAKQTGLPYWMPNEPGTDANDVMLSHGVEALADADQGCPYDSDTSKGGSCLMPVSLEDFIATFYYQASDRRVDSFCYRKAKHINGGPPDTLSSRRDRLHAPCLREPPSRGRVRTAPPSHAHSEGKQRAADNPRGWMRAVSDAVRRDS